MADSFGGWGGERALGGVVDLGVGLVFELLQIFFGQNSLADQQIAEPLDRVAGGLVDALLFGTVERFVVRLRMRVRPDDVGVNQRGAAALAGVLDGAAERLVTGQEVRPVALLDVEAGKEETRLEMLPPAVCTSTGTEIAYPLSSIR